MVSGGPHITLGSGVGRNHPLEIGTRGDQMANWETCPAVERHPLRVGGAWVFKGTRVPVAALFENLKAGASIDQFLEWFQGVDRWKVETVLDHELGELAETVAS